MCNALIDLENNWRKHKKLQHVKCCDKVVVGKAASKHINAGHDFEELEVPEPPKREKQTPPSMEEVQCSLGCGARMIRKQIEKHHSSAHLRCRICNVVVQKHRSVEAHAKASDPSHTSVPSHDRDFVPVERPRRPDEQREASPGAVPRAPPIMVPPPQQCEQPQIPTEKSHADAVKHLLDDLEIARRSCGKHATRWSRNLILLAKLLPDHTNLPFARVVSPAKDDLCHGEADVWQVTNAEVETLLDSGVRLDKPLLVRRPPGADAGKCRGVGDFLEKMQDYFTAQDTVDVQDFTTKSTQAVKMKMDKVLSRLRQPTKASLAVKGARPINLLNLRGMNISSVAPEFLGNARFDVIPAINSRLQNASAPTSASVGKQSVAAVVQGREVDLISSSTFSLFAQRGCFTGFHMDCPDGTWVANCFGRKVWMFPACRNADSLQEFASEGDNWAPNVRIVVLDPGDTLIMPPGEIVPHAVLTIEDCFMTGGMIMDSARTIDCLKKLNWMAREPNITNESIPRQLLAGWPHLRDLFRRKECEGKEGGEQLLKEFDDLTQQLRSVLSCSCARDGLLECSPACPCQRSVIQDGQCTPWCAPEVEKASGSSRRDKRRKH